MATEFHFGTYIKTHPCLSAYMNAYIYIQTHADILNKRINNNLFIQHSYNSFQAPLKGNGFNEGLSA